MGMSTGGSGAPNINVTPLIDVLLVLLIIFMVITPLTPKGLSALVPQPPKDQKQQDTDDQRTIVVQVLKAGSEVSYKINQDETRIDDLQARLEDIFKTRAEKVAFVKGDSDVTFDTVAVAIDKIHAAGVDKVGLMTPKIEAGK
jgi:biopolymer transport protein ExbD